MSTVSDHTGSSDREREFVPLGVRIAAGWSWRLLLIVAASALVIWAVVEVRLVVIPVVVAVLLASLLRPLVLRFHRLGMNIWLSVAIVEVGFLAIVSALFWTIATQLSRGLSGLVEHSEAAYGQLKTFLLDSPLHITEQDINGYISSVVQSVQQDSQAIVSGALSVGTTAGHVAAGVLLVLFSLIFFLADGRTIFFWAMRLVPTRVRAAVSGAGHAGWHTLSSYVRVQILVAACDAVGIGIGAAILGLPMVLPLSILVFMGSFVPFVGAVVSGILVCVVALIYKGWIIALIMLAIVILVQQVESHVMQPLIMGSAVKVHPLGVVLSVAIGTMLAGIPGALFAVPFVAVTNRVVNYFGDRDWERDIFAKGVQLTIDEASGRSSFTGPQAASRDAAVVAAAVAAESGERAVVQAEAPMPSGAERSDTSAAADGDDAHITKG